ncbi:DUF2306 domain-containing protein [Reichenbachiella versicolor]|uniref:DUF2306 domain-containing protein n=1 Tax=Reichenbachiella versicolor TaxID=1821036 RepID=UPI0013A5779E|nr:DUF2306 domain-containing protein [Reichenbachiella versicolor]
MSAHYLYENQSGILRSKDIASNVWYLSVFRAHVLLGLVAISTGPFQFVNRIREKNRLIHKLFGYTYFISVGISSLCGIMIAPFSMGGWITSYGFTLLAIAWLFTTVKSLLAIKSSDLYNHRLWSYLSYALTFTAITQRTMLLIPLLTSVSFMPVYQLSAWLPWPLNLIIALLIFNSYSSTKS